MSDRLPAEVFDLPITELRAAYRSAVYFSRAKTIMERERPSKQVTMQVFQKGHSVLCGIDEAIAIVRTSAGGWTDPEKAWSIFQSYLQAHRDARKNSVPWMPSSIELKHREMEARFEQQLADLWVPGWDQLEVRALHDGDEIEPWEPVMTITGPYSQFAHLESVYLGVLARRTKVATNTRRVCEAAGNKPLLFFADRFDHFATQGGDGYACVDRSTEALTEHGWTRYDNLRVGDRILTLNPTTYLAEWSDVQAVNVYPPAPRRVLEVSGKTFSSLTTANHRWFTERRGWQRGEGASRWVRRETTSEGLVRDDRIPTAAPVVNLPDEPKWSDALVELVAWYWTEGNDRKPGPGRKSTTGAYIYQSHDKNPRMVDRIDAALRKVFGPPVGRLPGVPSEPCWRRAVWRHKSDLTEFRLNSAAASVLREHAPDRIPRPEWIASLTDAQLRLYIETALAADGDGNDPERVEREGLAQKDHRRAEMFQMACVLAGYDASLVYDATGDRWHVSLNRRSRVAPLLSDTARWTEHDGIVWCPTTANGTWLARRNGKVHYTGNSKIGGASGVATDAMAAWWGEKGMGTIPHALIAAYDGDTVAATKAFAEHYPDTNVIALVDFENDCVGTSLKCAHALGDKLWGVRLDTSETMVDVSLFEGCLGDFKPTGVNPALVQNVRDALDAEGYDHVKIVVSGGFNVDKIRMFEDLDVPADIYAVGSSLLQGAQDFTADLVRPVAKMGRWERDASCLELVE